MSGNFQQLEVRNLNVEVFDEAIAFERAVVSDVSFTLAAGQGLGITGESGSGKTTLSLALSSLLPQATRVSADSVRLIFGTNSSIGTDPSSAATQPNVLRNTSLHAQLPRLRGSHIFTLFQEPRASLNPYRTIGWQLRRCARRRRWQTRGGNPLAATEPSATPILTQRTLPTPYSVLSEVGLDPDVLHHYPHELSTGMCQRVFLAMASLLGSSILIADEPFASVDSETQARLVSLVRNWMQTRGVTIVLVSHDLVLLRQLTDQVVVMYRGQVAESGPTREVLSPRGAAHPYTLLLDQISDPVKQDSLFTPNSHAAGSRAACCFSSRCAWSDHTICVQAIPAFRPAVPTAGSSAGIPVGSHQLRCLRHPVNELQFTEITAPFTPSEKRPYSDQEILRVKDAAKEFATGWLWRKHKPVLSGVTFSVHEGERLGIMGPSGQGKTTLARILLGVVPPSHGRVDVALGNRWLDVSQLRDTDRTQFRRCVQMVYQDTDQVLDPAARVGDALVEAYQVFNPRLGQTESYRLSAQLLDELALPVSMLEAYPYRLSGGERKRIALARTLAALGCPFSARQDDPWRLLVMDEPTAGVDVVLQAILARFLIWVQQRLRVSYLVISHDEEFVRRFCHRTLRLENGHVSSADLSASV